MRIWYKQDGDSVKAFPTGNQSSGGCFLADATALLPFPADKNLYPKAVSHHPMLTEFGTMGSNETINRSDSTGIHFVWGASSRMGDRVDVVFMVVQ